MAGRGSPAAGRPLTLSVRPSFPLMIVRTYGWCQWSRTTQAGARVTNTVFNARSNA
jgi:hypothetical protein